MANKPRKSPKSDAGNLSNPHDKFFKEIFGQPDLAADFVRNYLPPAIVNSIDLPSLEVQKESFLDEKLEESFADLIYRVRLRGSKETAFVCLLFEHKSFPDKWVALQILAYLLKFWERLKANNAKKLPLIFPVLFYHGETRWKYEASFSALFEHQYLTAETFAEWQPYTPNFSYYLCDLSALEETTIRGQAVLRATLLMMKNIHRLHEAPHLLNVWQAFGKVADQSAVQYIRVMLKYASEANATLDQKRGLAFDQANVFQTRRKNYGTVCGRMATRRARTGNSNRPAKRNSGRRTTRRAKSDVAAIRKAIRARHDDAKENDQQTAVAETHETRRRPVGFPNG
ncbi:MAG TPA: Rpn family recombination-promoting nuclease/putative transposase [Blastocatellia bacterium]|nr:Rpn family recombination-promoting nuclease/putative transposase [Blastocatellia bacterium]